MRGAYSILESTYSNTECLLGNNNKSYILGVLLVRGWVSLGHLPYKLLRDKYWDSFPLPDRHFALVLYENVYYCCHRWHKPTLCLYSGKNLSIFFLGITVTWCKPKQPYLPPLWLRLKMSFQHIDVLGHYFVSLYETSFWSSILPVTTIRYTKSLNYASNQQTKNNKPKNILYIYLQLT